MKRYEDPRMEVLAIEVADILTTSAIYQRDSDEAAEDLF